MTPKPEALPPILDGIPAALRAIPRWIGWKHHWHKKREKWIKLPVNPNDPARAASVSNPATWSDFDTAVFAYEFGGNLDGLGFVFADDGVVGIDFDHKLDPLTGEMADELTEAMARIPGFWEMSPSGTGVHCLTRAVLDKAHKDDKAGIEIYRTERYFTVTGRQLRPDTIPDSPVDLSWFVEKHFGPDAVPARPKDLAVAKEGPGDFFRRVNDAGLANLGLWIPVLFTEASESAKGYRITSAQLGRDLEEDISATPEGIKDFGVHDMGDRHSGGRTPIDLVMEHYADQLAGGDVLQTPDAVRAALWLCEQMKLEPAELGWKPPANQSEANVQMDFETDENGRPQATVGNVLVAMRSVEYVGCRIGLDAFRDEIMVAAAGTEDWRPFTDPDYTRLRWLLELKGFKTIGRELMRDVVHLVADESRFDSAITWLAGLAWDQKPRCDRFLCDYLGAEDTPYTRATSLYLWSAMAGRVMSPGCKADMALILVGPQGIGKSSAAAAMAPSPDQFCEISLAEQDDDLARKMRGRLVGEIGELRGLNSRDLDAIKTFISRTHEDWTPKYKEFNQKFARRLVFVGTTNNDEFLADETGNRRWLPVRVTQANLPRIKEDLLFLWAEARELFAARGVLWQEAEKLGAGVHAEFVVTDVWEDRIRAWLDGSDCDELLGNSEPRRLQPIRTSDVLEGALDLEPGRLRRGDEMRIARILPNLGYVKRRIAFAGIRNWYWLHPDSEAYKHARPVSA